MIPKTIHLLGCTWQQLVKVSWWSAAISVRWNSKCVHGAPFWFVALNLTPKGLMDIAWCVDFDCQGRDPGTSLNNLFRSHQTWSEITKATHVIRQVCRYQFFVLFVLLEDWGKIWKNHMPNRKRNNHQKCVFGDALENCNKDSFDQLKLDLSRGGDHQWVNHPGSEKYLLWCKGFT